MTDQFFVCPIFEAMRRICLLNVYNVTSFFLKNLWCWHIVFVFLFFLLLIINGVNEIYGGKIIDMKPHVTSVIRTIKEKKVLITGDINFVIQIGLLLGVFANFLVAWWCVWFSLLFEKTQRFPSFFLVRTRGRVNTRQIEQKILDDLARANRKTILYDARNQWCAITSIIASIALCVRIEEYPAISIYEAAFTSVGLCFICGLLWIAILRYIKLKHCQPLSYVKQLFLILFLDFLCLLCSLIYLFYPPSVSLLGKINFFFSIAILSLFVISSLVMIITLFWGILPICITEIMLIHWYPYQ